jgi:hypothetical protein
MEELEIPAVLLAAHEAGHLGIAIMAGAVPSAICAGHPDFATVLCSHWPDDVSCLDRAAFAAAGIVAEQRLGWPLRMSARQLAAGDQPDGEALAFEAGHGIDPIMRSCVPISSSPASRWPRPPGASSGWGSRPGTGWPSAWPVITRD